MKLLLTEGSSMNTRETLFALGQRHTVDVLDPSTFCHARFSSLVRRVYRCPSIARDPDSYLRYLIKRLQIEKYDALVPSHEEIYLVARHQEEIRQHVAVALPDFDALHRAQGKAEFVRLLDELQLPQPASRIVRNRAELVAHSQFPCFVKVDYSTAGNGVVRADDPKRLETIADQFEQHGWLSGANEIVIQAAAHGPQGVCYGVFQHGRLVGCHSIKLRRPGIGGWTINGVSATHPLVHQHVAAIGEHLRWHGALFVDYFFDPHTKTPSYIECNARPGGFFIAQLAGCDLGEQFLRVTLDQQTVEPLPVAAEGARFHQSMVMLLSRAMEGASRRQIAHEIWDSCWKAGFYQRSEDTVTRVGDDWLSLFPRLGISLLLLLRPAAAQAVVRGTIAKYALPEETARRIRE